MVIKKEEFLNILLIWNLVLIVAIAIVSIPMIKILVKGDKTTAIVVSNEEDKSKKGKGLYTPLITLTGSNNSENLISVKNNSYHKEVFKVGEVVKVTVKDLSKNELIITEGNLYFYEKIIKTMSNPIFLIFTLAILGFYPKYREKEEEKIIKKSFRKIKSFLKKIVIVIIPTIISISIIIGLFFKIPFSLGFEEIKVLILVFWNFYILMKIVAFNKSRKKILIK